MNVPFMIAKTIINPPYFNNTKFRVFFVEFLEIIDSMLSKACLTNSAGYNAKIFAININIVPIINKLLYFIKYLFKNSRFFKCNFIQCFAMTKIITNFANRLKKDITSI